MADQSKSGRTYYQVLGIEQSSSPKEVKLAFLRRSKELHPDRNPDDAEAHGNFVLLYEAYRVLSNTGRRTSYDQSLNKRPRINYKANNGEWRDDSLWEMRDRSEDQHYGKGHYYGIKGVKRLPNWCIVTLCVAFLSIGAFGHYLAVKYGREFTEHRLNQRDMKLSEMYMKTRAKAKNSSTEETLRELQRAVEEQRSRDSHNQPNFEQNNKSP